MNKLPLPVKHLQPKYAILILVLLILVIFSAGLYYNFSSIQQFTLKVLGQQSYVDIYSSNGTLKFSLSVSSRDDLSAGSYFNQLGLDKSQITSLEIGIDADSLQAISDNLPMRLLLTFKKSKNKAYTDILQFKSDQSSPIAISLPDKKYDIATDSAQFHLLSQKNTISLQIAEPDKVIQQASSSSELYISKQLTGVLPTLKKISTIDIQANEKEIKGEIQLK